MPEDFKPIPEVGSGEMEIRVHGDNEYRVFYVARYEEAVYVLHCFVKKTQAHRNEEEVMKTTIDTTITMGSGDVFTDLGFSPAECRNLQIRSQMLTALRKFIEKEGLTQAEAAKRLKVSQPRVSDLTRGKISRFSLDTLVNMLSDAGLEVDFRIKVPARRVA